MHETGDSRATDEDLRLTVVHLVVALVTKLQETKINVSFSGTELSSLYLRCQLLLSARNNQESLYFISL